MAFIFPIGLGGGFYAPARANTSLRSLPITCRGKKTPQHIKSSHKKKCCGIEVLYEKWKLIGDSIIYIGGHKFNIRSITNKEMLLERNNKVGRLKFIK